MILSEWARRLALISHCALIAALVLRSGLGNGLLLIVPLLLPLPGLVKQRAYTYAWASMLVTFYVAGFLSGAYAHPEAKRVSFALAALAAVDFVSLVLYVRLRARERTAQAQSEQRAASDAASR